MKVFRFDDEGDTVLWFVALDLADAMEQVGEFLGVTPGDEFAPQVGDSDCWTTLDDGALLSINVADEGEPPNLQSKTCAEWAAQVGRGFLAGQES